MDLEINHSRTFHFSLTFIAFEVALGAIAFISPILFGILCGVLVAIFLELTISDVSFLKTMVFLIPFGVIFKLGNFEFSAVQLLILTVLLFTVLKYFTGHWIPQRNSLQVWMGFFIIMFFISLIKTLSLFESFKEIFRWIPFLFCFFFACKAFETEHQIKRIVWWMIGLLIAQVLIAFILFPTVTVPVGNIRRLIGTMINPNTLAIYLVLNLGLVTSLWLSSIAQNKRLWAFFAMCISLLAIIFTHTRGAWIAAIFTILSLLFFKGKKERKRVIVFLVGLLLLGIVVTAIFSLSIDVFKHTKGSVKVEKKAQEYDTAFVRLFETIVVLNTIKGHPFIGTGLGTFRIVLESQLIDLPNIIDFTADSFNVYLQLWLELGLFGLIAFLLIVFVILKRGRQLSKYYQDDPELQAIVVGILASIIGFLVQGFTDMVLLSICGFLFWIEVGMIFALERFSSEKGRELKYG